MTRRKKNLDAAALAALFEANAQAALIERGPAPLKPVGHGRVRWLKTEKGDPISHGQVMQALFTKHGIENAVQDGVRPKTVFCGECRLPVAVKRCSGALPTFCGSICRNRSRHKKEPRGECSGCGGPVGSRSLKASGKCRRCVARLTIESARAVAATITPAARSEATRKANRARSLPQRQAAARAANAALSSEQRRAAARKGHQRRSPEQRSEASRRAAETRRRQVP